MMDVKTGESCGSGITSSMLFHTFKGPDVGTGHDGATEGAGVGEAVEVGVAVSDWAEGVPEGVKVEVAVSDWAEGELVSVEDVVHEDVEVGVAVSDWAEGVPVGVEGGEREGVGVEVAVAKAVTEGVEGGPGEPVMEPEREPEGLVLELRAERLRVGVGACERVEVGLLPGLLVRDGVRGVVS